MTRLKRSHMGREVQRDQINQVDQKDLMDQMSQMDREDRINQTGKGRIYQVSSAEMDPDQIDLAQKDAAQMDLAQISSDVRRRTLCSSSSTNCCIRCPPSNFKNLLDTASLLAGRFL